MSDKPENPPAFPTDVTVSERGKFPIITEPREGMTLLDYFAAKVAQGLVANDNTDTPEWVAMRAYEVADAMLAAREASRKGIA